MSSPVFRAFLDESSANRGDERQEYLVCAALISDADCDSVREQLRPLLLPGQIKLHWTDESERRRRDIVSRIVDLGPMNIVVSHLDARRKRVERYRRKSLEVLYHELVTMETFDLTLECRSDSQDKDDRAHIVALQSQGLDRRLRIGHQRGGDEPLLWIADAVLGSINAAHLGNSEHYDELQSTLLIEARTSDSLAG
ncbi:hypothetical protein ITJ42_16235 [Clavibacter michiganensis subsp. phaseoli]|uniref:DUF3800 domain-containing protein n=1 Tax=Clavibacter phaseoli TaxID=1734031 RepID=A0A8I0SC71_9MICO|nr:hypothetical protein [Clavibacter phaseoli]MBF4632766.1 hypothetical protein [Clavibacter phaseoli]